MCVVKESVADGVGDRGVAGVVISRMVPILGPEQIVSKTWKNLFDYPSTG